MSTIRGLWTHAGTLYAVIDNQLKSISPSGTALVKGNLNSLGGNIDFVSNLTQLVINDGSYLYIYNPTAGTFTSVGAVGNYPGGDRISIIDQRVVFQFRGTQKFGYTALGDAGTIDPLAFFSAESSPDLLVANAVFQRELWLLGEDSTEIWDSIGGLTVFSRSSAAIDYGCAAPFSVQKTASSLIWLSRDGRGNAMVLSAQGHQAKRISTRAQEEMFQGITLSNATAYTYSDGGQSFYCLNVPALSTTLVWDEAFQQWHERAEWNGLYSKWRPTCHAFAYGKHYFGCGSDIYTSDYTVNTFGTNVKRRQRTAPVISKPGRERTFFPSFEVVCEKGTGAQIELRWSDDNGYTWSNWHYASVGAVGQFVRKARFSRLGSAYDRVFELVMTDNAPFNPVAVNVPI